MHGVVVREIPAQTMKIHEKIFLTILEKFEKIIRNLKKLKNIKLTKQNT